MADGYKTYTLEVTLDNYDDLSSSSGVYSFTPISLGNNADGSNALFTYNENKHDTYAEWQAMVKHIKGESQTTDEQLVKISYKAEVVPAA